MFCAENFIIAFLNFILQIGNYKQKNSVNFS